MPAPRNESSTPVWDVPGRELLEQGDDLRLGQRGLDVELAREPHGRGDLLEELVDRGDADRREHRVRSSSVRPR